jgi:L-malate glycosyltransferase
MGGRTVDKGQGFNPRHNDKANGCEHLRTRQGNVTMIEGSEKTITVCITGPMLSGHPGKVTTQGEILGDLLAKNGFRVIRSSSSLNRYRRLGEILGTILRYRREIDVLCVQTFGGPSFVVEDAATLLGLMLGLPIVMQVHGGAMPEFVKRFRRWSRRVLSRSDDLVVPSPYLGRYLGGLGFQVKIIPNVIEIADYDFKPRRCLRPRLLWMRTFHPIYNPMMAVRVLDRLRHEFPDATLVLAGEEKGLAGEVRLGVERLGLGDRVRFASFLDREGKRREADAADVFLNTNHIDNTPVSVIEACALGLPVVSTDVGGLRDLLTDGETGLLVPDDDCEAMAAAVTRLLNDPGLAERLSRNGRLLAEHCDWNQVWPLWNELLTGVAGRRRAASCEPNVE